jgi:Rrf2 family transcriptional regulator, iron-sulfur cluster assembly transcription factor
MKFNSTVEQAICILVLLSTQERNIPLASNEISRILDVSPSYLKKITRKLVVHKIISSVPGNNGGISLEKNAEEVTALDIIEAIEGCISIFNDTGLIKKAFHEGRYSERGTEIVRNVFEEANELLKDYFSKITVANLMKEMMGRNELPKLDWNTVVLADYVKESDESK